MAVSGETIATVAVSDTIDIVRAKLSKLTGVPPHHLRLSWCEGEWRLVIDTSRLCLAVEFDEAILDDLADRYEDFRSLLQCDGLHDDHEPTPAGLNCLWFLLCGVDFENDEPMTISLPEAVDTAIAFIRESCADHEAVELIRGSCDWSDREIEELLMRCAAGIYHLADRQAG